MKLLGNRPDMLSVPYCYPLTFSCEWEKLYLRDLYIRNPFWKAKIPLSHQPSLLLNINTLVLNTAG